MLEAETFSIIDIIFFTIVALIFVLLNGFFVAAEFALVGVRHTKMQDLATKSSRAKAVLKLLEHQDTVISATQFGITLSSLALGYVAGAFFEPVIVGFLSVNFPGISGSEIDLIAFVIPISFGAIIAISFTTYLHVVLGELVFKSVALQYPDGTSIWVAKPLAVFTKVASPLIWVFNSTAWFVLKFFGIKPATGLHNIHSEDELKIIINQSQKAGILDEHETEILSRAFDLADTTVREIMTPKSELVMIKISDNFNSILDQVLESGHSRFPVYEDNIDKIAGFIYAKDILQFLKMALQQNNNSNFNPNLRSILRDPDFVPETMHADDLLEMFQNSKRQVAIVVTEFGNVAGLISLEDVLELLVGDIQDEYDIEPPNIHSTDEGDVINGQMSIDDFNEHYNTNYESDHSVSIGGFIIEKFGKIPEEKEFINLDNFLITIQKIADHRINELLVVFTEPPIAESEDNDKNGKNGKNGKNEDENS